ncbi:unnamed protein product [Fraxinus pennsylvanica]|uniref:Pectinesterase inhibitor domain-containing protein n=1 Tax=Fraxinus pennsylvanica TaxID=56036 RepID=A0AAD2E1B2_9LAMI|nr:unnamed protein product [Fraxinus pennsylvanica]
MNKKFFRVIGFSCRLSTCQPNFRSKSSSFDHRRGWPGALHHRQVGCSQTDYKCVDSMSSLANNVSATPNDFLHAATNAAIEEVQAAMYRSLTIGQAANASFQKMAVYDYKELLEYADEELQASYSMVQGSNFHTAEDREAELKKG